MARKTALTVFAALALAAAGAEKPGPITEVVAYAATEYTSKEARDVEVRLGSITAFKLWVNGELVLVRGDAYTGMELDHYVARARLKPGKNTILLKIWMDTPPPQLPKVWRFQLRVCDASGAAVLSATRPSPSPPTPLPRSGGEGGKKAPRPPEGGEGLG